MTTASRIAHAHAIIQSRIAAVVASLSPAERDAKHIPEVSIAVPVDVLVTAREALEHQMPRDAFGLPGHAWPPPADDVREALARVIEAAWGDPTWDGKTLRPVDRKIADAILAAFEVRPHGTVNDAVPDITHGMAAQTEAQLVALFGTVKNAQRLAHLHVIEQHPLVVESERGPQEALTVRVSQAWRVRLKTDEELAADQESRS